MTNFQQSLPIPTMKSFEIDVVGACPFVTALDIKCHMYISIQNLTYAWLVSLERGGYVAHPLRTAPFPQL
jgi:hypothetical protein